MQALAGDIVMSKDKTGTLLTKLSLVHCRRGKEIPIPANNEDRLRVFRSIFPEKHISQLAPRNSFRWKHRTEEFSIL